MAVLLLTIFLSSCLAGIFVVCFVGESRRSRHSSLERDSLLPFDDDLPPPPRPPDGCPLSRP